MFNIKQNQYNELLSLSINVFCSSSSVLQERITELYKEKKEKALTYIEY